MIRINDVSQRHVIFAYLPVKDIWASRVTPPHEISLSRVTPIFGVGLRFTIRGVCIHRNESSPAILRV
jgi:hypothetical protein